LADLEGIVIEVGVSKGNIYEYLQLKNSFLLEDIIDELILMNAFIYKIQR